MSSSATTLNPDTETARRYFPGWTMLGVAAAAQYMSAPGQSYSVAAFKDPMRAALTVSETNYSLAYGFATVLSACLLPFVGRLVDRFGARLMLPVIALGLGGGCCLMSQVQSLPQLYLGFSVVRSLGQGALSLISVWLVGEWFQRKRGIASAIAGIGGGLSVMTIPLLNNVLIRNYGWESAWVALAIGVWSILIIPSLVLLRNRPEDIGLNPDGIDPDTPPPDLIIDGKRVVDLRPVITPDSWTVAEAIRDATFWKLLSVPATSALVGTGLVFHQVALLGSHGLSASWALAMMSVQAAFATAITFPAGWATDRCPSRYLLFVAMVSLAMATLLAITMPSIWLIVAYALCLGLQGSIMRSTGSVVWINYYGRANQGAVRGVAWSVMILASALGPLPLAYSIDRFGTYNPALYLFLTLPVAAGIAVWTAHPPKRKSNQA